MSVYVIILRTACANFILVLHTLSTITPAHPWLGNERPQRQPHGITHGNTPDIAFDIANDILADTTIV
jgi:hypothetical protein